MTSEAVRKRVAALLNKTLERGCTEAEALAAAAKAAELMREYGISEADLAIDEASVRRRTEGHSARDYLWRRLAFATNTVTIMDVDQAKAIRTYLGREPGPQIASYLHVVLDRALDRAVADFKGGTYYRRRRTLATKRQVVAQFTQGMVARLIVRLDELFADGISSEAWDAANSALMARYPGSVSLDVRQPTVKKVTTASMDGYLAGDAVSLAHGVGGGGPVAMIGGAR